MVVEVETRVSHGVLILTITYKRPLSMSNKAFNSLASMHAAELGDVVSVTFSTPDCKYIKAMVMWSLMGGLTMNWKETVKRFVNEAPNSSVEDVVIIVGHAMLFYGVTPPDEQELVAFIREVKFKFNVWRLPTPGTIRPDNLPSIVLRDVSEARADEFVASLSTEGLDFNYTKVERS